MQAATYCRSSKDRHDVSLAAQFRELEKLATSRRLSIVQQYEDAVESGSSDDRPAFNKLVADIKNPHRDWSYLLIYDTSRLARGRYIAQAFKHQAKKCGVTILYSQMPADMDPVAELVLESVFEAFDEAHSIMSRKKGLAGMSENVKQGWRAGGRAPIGYSLEAHATGAVRDGKPVTKSKLVPSGDARAVAAYLKARALGTPRSVAMLEAGIEKPENTMVCVEWNALAYAGHTVWNRHAVQGNGNKMRPREDWQVTRDTHQALISDAEAEIILSRLQTSNVAESIRRAKAAASDYLLTGLLFTTDEQMWVAHGRYYRLRARRGGKNSKLVPATLVDEAVRLQVQADRQSDLYLRRLLDAAKKSRKQLDPAAAVESRIRQLEREKMKAAELALQSDGPTFLAMVSDKAKQIDALRREVTALKADDTLGQHLSGLTVDSLRSLLAAQQPEQAVKSLVERVILEPDLTCRLHYKVAPGRSMWPNLASPRGFEDWPPDLTRDLTLRKAG